MRNCRDPLEPAVANATRVLLRDALRRGRPAEGDLAELRDAVRVLVLRSANATVLRSFLDGLAGMNRAAAVSIVTSSRDVEATRAACPEAAAVIGCPATDNFTWAALVAAQPPLLEPPFDAYVFLTNNTTAAGYDNVIDIFSRLSPHGFHAFTADARLLRFTRDDAAVRRGHAQFAGDIASWFWGVLDEWDIAR
jgi:hypothetical protein